jgi:hypothetical protein
MGVGLFFIIIYFLKAYKIKSVIVYALMALRILIYMYVLLRLLNICSFGNQQLKYVSCLTIYTVTTGKELPNCLCHCTRFLPQIATKEGYLNSF